MFRRTAVWMLAAAVTIGAVVMCQAMAQDAGGGGRGGRGGRGGPRMTPEERRAEMDKQLRDSLGVTDDAEWKVLQPKIEKVQTLQRDGRGGMGFMFRGRGGPGGDQGAPADRPQSEVQKKLADLQKALDNKDSKPEDIKGALTAYREARAANKAELEKAQKDLKGVVTPKQEAVLVAHVPPPELTA